MVWILLAFMIYWDHPNLLPLSSSTYKRRGDLMEKISFGAFRISLDWIELWRLLAWLDEPFCQDRL
jgi:negative regulator of sigma E activity